MMTYQQRSDAGTAHEAAVTDWLWLQGWLVQTFGLALFNGVMRDRLRDYRLPNGSKTPLRWLPDMLAARPQPDGRQVAAFVDAKYSDRAAETGNQDVEVDALKGAMAAWRLWGIPVWFVFNDETCIRADVLDGQSKRIHEGVGEHRTDFWLFPSSTCLPFLRVFGKSPSESARAAS